MTRTVLIAAAIALMMLAWPARSPYAGAQTTAPSTPAAVPTSSAGASAMPAIVPTAAATAGIPTEAPDPYLWLEDVSSPRAMAWVRAENAKTLSVLRTDPHYAALYAQALAINQAEDRIPAPEFIARRVYNFWQDARHVRGIWRFTTLSDYVAAQPHWTTVLDLDAVAKAEHANWVWEGADCDWTRTQRCLISLSDGGEDAVTVREFDLRTRAFVAGGFRLPHGKQDATWADPDSLLVARAWKPGELTASGYPYVIKRLRRGRPLASAVEVFRGSKTDIFNAAQTYADVQGDRLTVIHRGLTFFTSLKYVVGPHGIARIGVPLKSSFSALIDGRVLLKIDEAWTIAGHTYKAGSLVSVELAALNADPAHLKPMLVYQPGPLDSLGTVATTRSAVIVTTYHNVRGRAFVYDPLPHNRWSVRRLALPDDSSIAIADADPRGDGAFVSVTGYLTPTTLWLVDTRSTRLSIAKRLPAKFDASKDVVDQREATSKDGTRIPYFVVHPKAMRLDGSNPTILYAYGGFQVSLTPNYPAAIGKLWLERGGVYVVANIRGGGEFGPAWHEAGLKTHRQRIYDDFAAVAQALIADKVTSPRRLGIQGGSNGGLLMGVEFTEHPELWHAVDIQVPLLDMLRFEKIAAGASWVGEYGSVSIPAQRAFLAKISPYNNIVPGVAYPEPFIWTTTKDDRVGPQHARKFAARLSEYHIPYLYYEVTEGGHGAGANLAERARTTALEMTYFIRKLMTPAGKS